MSSLPFPRGSYKRDNPYWESVHKSCGCMLLLVLCSRPKIHECSWNVLYLIFNPFNPLLTILIQSTVPHVCTKHFYHFEFISVCKHHQCCWHQQLVCLCAILCASKHETCTSCSPASFTRTFPLWFVCTGERFAVDWKCFMHALSMYCTVLHFAWNNIFYTQLNFNLKSADLVERVFLSIFKLPKIFILLAVVLSMTVSHKLFKK